MDRRKLIQGDHPELGRLYAVVDARVRYTTPAVSASRLGASLNPFADPEAARAALIEAGAILEGGAK